MSTASPHPDLPADEELVAYLDGELPPEACRNLESRLATDATLRRQLHELEVAWEALDSLPRTTVDDEFARTTIEMVAVAAEQDASQQAAVVSRARRQRVLLLTAAGIGVAAVGFAAFRTLAPDANQSLLEDLPAITQVDVLAQFKDVDFLRRLRQQTSLEDLADDQEALDQEMKQLQAAGSPSRDERRQWIEQLSSDEKADLVAKSERFRNLLPATQQRLKDLSQEISQADDASELQRTMLAYGQWVARRPEGEQAELRELPTDKRLDRIAHLVRREDRQAARQLPAEDAVQLRNEVLAIVDERKEQIEQFMSQRRMRGGADPERQLELRRWAVGLWIVNRELRNDQERDAMRDRLTGRLTPKAQEQLASLPPRERDWQLAQWVHDSLRPNRGPEALEKFFAEKLTIAQRERLLSLPAAEMEAELERLYIGEQLGLRDTQWRGDFGDRGRFGRPPRGPEGRPRDRERHDGPPPPIGPQRDGLDHGRIGPGPPDPLLDRPRPNRQPPPDWQPPPERRPPPIDHEQEPI